MQGFGLASSPFALDHCSMRFVSAAVARSFVADVPAPVVCFFLASAPLVAKAPARSAACRGLCAAPYAGRAMRAAKFKFAQTHFPTNQYWHENVCLWAGCHSGRMRAGHSFINVRPQLPRTL